MKYVVILLVVFIHQALQAQYPDLYSFKGNKQKAVTELKQFPNPDTNRINALIKVFSTATFLKERQEVLPYRLEAMELSRKLSYIKGLATCYLNAGSYFKSASSYPDALHQYDSVLYITTGTNDPKLLELRAITYERMGSILFEQGNFYTALDHFFESLKLAENDPERKSRVFSFITGIYVSLHNLDKATEFGKQNVDLVGMADSSIVINASVFFSMIDIALAKNDFTTAIFYLDKMGRFMPDPKEVQVNYGYYLDRGHVYYQKEMYNDAMLHYQQAYKYAVMGGHKRSQNEALRFLSRVALKLGDQESAKKYALENLSLSEERNTKQEKADALINLSEYYNATGNKTRALELLQQATLLKDSLMTEANIKQANILGAIYETDKQDKEIARLEREKEKQDAAVKQKSVLNIFFIVSIIILLIIGYLGYSNFRKGQQLARKEQALQKQKIIELEKDKQLLTIDAMLQGQEEERSRIAKDLHDGLGSTLSGTKLSFLNLRENMLLTPDSARMFDKSLSMLDNTIGDLRKVAQNLMPEALVKYGLIDALRDFCESIQATSGLKVLFQHFGKITKMDNTAEVFIYRMIQELVNNVIKHAEATEVIVQLAMTNNKLGITVEDNGKGFDKTILGETKGAGMANIRYRMQYFNGTSDIVTAPGKGTSVNIELTI